MPDGLPDVPTEMLDSLGDAVEGVEPSAPVAVEESNQAAVETPATPEGETQEAATEAPDSFTKLDPNALPEEVRPYYQSMLSDYTRKTQEAAPWRKLGEELGVESPDAFREAAELYAYLQDPNNLHNLYTQLGQVLGQQPASPQAPATAPTVPQGTEDEFAALENPEVAQIKTQLEQLTSYLQEREAAQQQEALQWALLGEMNRQEALVKEQHPDWGEEEWNALWNLSVAYNGDLMSAANHVEAAQNAAVTRLLNGKAQAADTPGLTPVAPPRLGTAVESHEDWSEDHELAGPTAAAREYLRGVVNMSE